MGEDDDIFEIVCTTDKITVSDVEVDTWLAAGESGDDDIGGVSDNVSVSVMTGSLDVCCDGELLNV